MLGVFDHARHTQHLAFATADAFLYDMPTGMSTDAKRQEIPESRRAEFRARWEAVAAHKARELASMTEERAGEIIQSLAAVEAWRQQPEWSGLVEQQALFHRKPRS